MPGHGQAFGYTVFFTGRGLGTLYKLMLYLHPDKKFSQNQPQIFTTFANLRFIAMPQHTN